MSDTNETRETETWAQMHAPRGGWRPLRRDGQEYEQTCRRGHKYESDSPEPQCPTCAAVFTEVDIEAEMSAFRAQNRSIDAAFGMVIVLAILSVFAWCLWSGIEAQGRIDDAQEVQRW